MGGIKYFTSIDLYSEYWQWCIANEDIAKTTYPMRYSLYKWVVMPMGLTNAPAIFMHTKNNLFSNILDSGMAVFPDNMYSCIVKEHFILLKKVLACLHQYTSYCKPKKCSFICNSKKFLGFDITLEYMCIGNSKVKSLNEWPVPTIIK